MASPFIPLAGLGLCGLVVWRAFRGRSTYQAKAENGWQNENFALSEAGGSFAESGSSGDYHQSVPLTGSGLGSGGCG